MTCQVSPVCYLHAAEGGLGMPNVKFSRQTLLINFLDRMCRQEDRNGKFWKGKKTQGKPLKCVL